MLEPSPSPGKTQAISKSSGLMTLFALRDRGLRGRAHETRVL